MATIRISNIAGHGLNMSGVNGSGWFDVSADPSVRTVLTYDDGATLGYEVIGDPVITDFYVNYATDGYNVFIEDVIYFHGAQEVAGLLDINVLTTVDDLNADTAIANFTSGDDDIFGNDYRDLMRGGPGNDALFGYKGNDTLKGDSGSDLLVGGAGADKLYGGSGTDFFVFLKASDSTAASKGRDTIYDFTSSDFIDVSDIDANTKKGGNQAFSFIGTDKFHGKAGELRFEKKASDTYIYADTNGDKKADFAIHLDDAVKLAKADFFL